MAEHQFPINYRGEDHVLAVDIPDDVFKKAKSGDSNAQSWVEKALTDHASARFGPEEAPKGPAITPAPDNSSFAGRFSQVMPEDSDKGVGQGLLRGVQVLNPYEMLRGYHDYYQRVAKHQVTNAEALKGIPIVSDIARIASGDIAGEAASFAPAAVAGGLAVFPKLRGAFTGPFKALKETPPTFSRTTPMGQLGALTGLAVDPSFHGMLMGGAVGGGLGALSEALPTMARGAAEGVRSAPWIDPAISRHFAAPAASAEAAPAEAETLAGYSRFHTRPALPPGPSRVFPTGDPQAVHYPAGTAPEVSLPVEYQKQRLIRADPDAWRDSLPPETQEYLKRILPTAAPTQMPPAGTYAAQQAVQAPAVPAAPAAPAADPMEVFRRVEATKAPVAAPVAAAPEVKPTVQVEKPAPKPEVQAVKSAPKPAPVKSEPAKPEPVKSESKYRTVEPPVKIKSEPARLAQLQAKDNPSSAEMDEMERLIKKGVSPPKSAETALGNKEIDPKTLETSPRAGAEKQALEAHKMPADEYEKSETDRRKLTTELLDKHKKTPLTPEETTQLRNAFTDAPADKIGLGEIASLARSHSVTTSQMARKLIDIGVPIEESKVGGYGLGTKMSTKSLEAHGKLDEGVILKQLEALGKRPEKFTETRGSIAKAQTDAVVGQVRKKMGLKEP